jgi:hypothetical protein
MASRLASHGDVLVRDSKDKHGPALHVTPEGWSGLVALVRTGQGDFGLV